jgi:hypothetical protein
LFFLILAATHPNATIGQFPSYPLSYEERVFEKAIDERVLAVHQQGGTAA